ncbi:hypothetical protein AAVH_33169, partial [Aphelenchoides avenae]
VHESLKQHAEHIHDELELKDAALQAELKRAQVSSSVIQQLRQKLLKTATASSQATNALDLQDHAQHVQRISALEAELHLKDTELQNEMQRVDLLSTSIKVLREELQKKVTATTSQTDNAAEFQDHEQHVPHSSASTAGRPTRLGVYM